MTNARTNATQIEIARRVAERARDPQTRAAAVRRYAALVSQSEGKR